MGLGQPVDLFQEGEHLLLNSTQTTTNISKGITLVPPEQNQAKVFNITYDMEYWGTESSIYASFGRGALEPTMSKSLIDLIVIVMF